MSFLAADGLNHTTRVAALFPGNMPYARGVYLTPSQ